MEDPVQKPVNPQDQIIPVSVSPHKEGEPSLISNPEFNLPQEVKEIGVEAVHENPRLDEVHRQLGVTLSGPSTPLIKEPIVETQVKLSMTK